MKRKIALLTGLALMLLSLAAPSASAEAPEWLSDIEKDETQVGEEEFHFSGTVSWATNFTTAGSCNVTFTGMGVNVDEELTGAIEQGTVLQGGCGTSLVGCAFVPTLEGFPWKLTGETVTGELGVKISGIKVTAHFGSYCQLKGYPSTLTLSGSATGLVEANEKCLNFENHKDDMLHSTVIGVDMEGAICLPFNEKGGPGSGMG